MALASTVILVLRLVALGKHHVSDLMDALYDILAVKVIPFGVHEIDPNSQAPHIHFIQRIAVSDSAKTLILLLFHFIYYK